MIVLSAIRRHRNFRDSLRGVCDERCCANGGDCDKTCMCHNDHDDYVWPDPHGNGWIDAWNGWYETEEEARRDGANGIGSPRVLAHGECIVTSEEAEARLAMGGTT